MCESTEMRKFVTVDDIPYEYNVKCANSSLVYHEKRLWTLPNFENIYKHMYVVNVHLRIFTYIILFSQL